MFFIGRPYVRMPILIDDIVYLDTDSLLHSYCSMKNVFKALKQNILLSFLFLILSDSAIASRLEEAAQRGQSIIISVGQITAVIGIVLGGIALSVGMANLGRMVLMSGVIGAAATFGGPAIIDMLKEVFR